MIKKIAAVLLAVLLCLLAAGCGTKDEAPDGMHLVSIDGEPFRLYVPDSWADNSASGVSGAYYSATDKITVSARYHTPTDHELTLDAYVQTLLEGYTDSLAIELIENKASILGASDAREIVYTAKHDTVEYTFRQIVTLYNGDFIILSFSCPTELYEANTEQMNSIVDEFVLCEKNDSEGDCVTDKKTPEGMKIASSDNIEYRLYVPTSWICNSESGKSEAYYPESGKPNITVTSYSPDSPLSATEYFEICEKEYKDVLFGYELLSTDERRVAERDAVSYTYRAVYGETSFKLMQTVLVYNEMIYSITYTALDDSFDTHIDDVNAILDAFIFR